MNFTPQELKLLERLRKRERQWHWARWVMLVVGIFCLGACAAFGFLLHSWITFVSSLGPLNTDAVLLLLLFWTKCCLYFFLGIWFLTTAILDWHGNANRTLLLKLLEAQQKDV